MGRRTIAATIIAVVSALLLAVGLGDAPASAAADSILLSRDGVHYSDALDRGLFDDAPGLVPGQSVSATLWVKNPTTLTTTVRVSVSSIAASSSVFANGVTLGAVNSATPGVSWVETLANVTPCQVLASIPSLAAGSIVRLTLTFTMGDMVGNVAQTDRAGLGLLVAMRDASGGSFPPSPCNDVGVVIASGSGASSGSVSASGVSDGGSAVQTGASGVDVSHAGAGGSAVGGADANVGAGPSEIDSSGSGASDKDGFVISAFTGAGLPGPFIIAGGLALGIVFFLLGRRRRNADRD